MAKSYSTRYRTAVAGLLRSGHSGEAVRLSGWVHRLRDLGGVVFFDLRDRSGLLQVSFDPEWSPEAVLRAARQIGPEDVVQVWGTVERRIKPNPEMATGEVEVRATRLEVLSNAEAVPIPVYRSPDEELPAEELRLRYRYLDLRRPELQRNFLLRHKAAQSVRRFLDAEGFIEVETPMLTRRTPEGARDYLVPSRVHPGEFYALPQSPQIYKQLLMVSGFDRYYQITRCLRDEDLRADRQPEFTQIDAEMSFVEEDDVYAVGEAMIARLWADTVGVELETPFPRLTFTEALLRYGTDKPDLRYGLEIMDLTELLQTTEFRIFQGTAGTTQRIRGMRVPGGASLSRKELDELQEVARRAGGAGALWVKRTEEGWSGQFAKALTDETADRFSEAAGLQAGDLFVAVVGEARVRTPETAGDEPFGPPDVAAIEPVLDALRRHLAKRLDLIDAHGHAWVWVTDFPMYEWDEDLERVVAAHHPFTAPHAEDIGLLREHVPADEPIAPGGARKLYRRGLRSRAYDAVYNGHELASGSVRIHDPQLQRLVFRSLGIEAEEAQRKFGFLLEAFRYGAPPHAGFAFGFDRLVMLLAGADNLRDVIAFPKTTSARALFEGAPSAIEDEELSELHIRVTETENQ